nr:haloacid dehalogenase-like hydrolase [Geodermatophilus normandii]
MDGTLVAGDSFGAFLQHLLTRRPTRLAAALLTAPVWVPALAAGRLRVPAERWLVWLAAVGLDADRFAAAARAFAAEHAGAAGERTAAAAVARLREHAGRGDRVVVATACALPLAAEVCRVIGLEDVEVVASDLRRTRWGPPAPAVPARGEGKVQALRAAGVPLPLSHAYSDSASDLPLLRAARVPHLVDPSPRDLARVRAALGPGVEVVRWARRRA